MFLFVKCYILTQNALCLLPKKRNVCYYNWHSGRMVIVGYL